MNHMIHIAAACQIRLDTPGRAYYRRKLAAGKTRAEAMRCLKRRISDAICRQLRADADARALTLEVVNAGPGGHRGASL
jgi:transposase